MTLLALLLAILTAPTQAARVAGGVVQSDEWRITRDPEKQEVFTGHVRYRTGPSVIMCDWALYKHSDRTWQLRGNVAIDHRLESDDRLQAWGDTAFFENDKKTGWLTAKDRVALKRTPLEGAPDHASAARADWQGRETATLTGLVHLWGPRLEAWSDRARYTASTSEIHLTGGRPVARKFPGWEKTDDFSGAVKADEIRAFRESKVLTADGAVRGWLEFPKDTK